MKKLVVIVLFLVCSFLISNAQDVIKKIDGTSISTKVTDQKGDVITFLSNGITFDIPKNDVAYVEYEKIGVIYYNKESIKILDVSDYNGKLYAEHNNIYIPTYGESLEQKVGASEFKSLIKECGKWNVVDCELEAHCSFVFVFDDSGSDHAYFYVKDRNGNIIWISDIVKMHSFSSTEAVKGAAYNLFRTNVIKDKIGK